MNTSTTSDHQQYANSFALLLAVAVHLSVWAVNWVICAAMTESWLAPWYTAVWYPQAGTIEHTVNQFFETTPGAILPATVFVAFDALILASLYRPRRAFVSVVLKSALLNFVYLIVVFLIGMVFQDVSRHYLSRPEIRVDYGYHLTGASIVLVTISIVALFSLKITRWRKMTKA